MAVMELIRLAIRADLERVATPTACYPADTVIERRSLTLDLSQEQFRPYFLWDEDLSIGELKQRLHGSDPSERERLMTKLLREARDIDVWQFVTPEEVAEALPSIGHRLGRRRGFWEFLIDGWRADGLLRE